MPVSSLPATPSIGVGGDEEFRELVLRVPGRIHHGNPPLPAVERVGVDCVCDGLAIQGVRLGVGTGFVDEFGESGAPDVEVESPSVGRRQPAGCVIGVVLGGDGGEGLCVRRHFSIRGEIEEVVSPDQLGVGAVRLGGDVEQSIETVESVDDLVHNHGSSVHLKCLCRV